MARRKDFKKANTYTGQKLKGKVVISSKIDGVRILFREDEYVTRNDKKPPGLKIALTQEAQDKIREFKDCEVYKNSFFESNAPLQRHHPEPGCIGVEHIYPLEIEGTKAVDERLIVTEVENPTQEEVTTYLEAALKSGYEGLVLRTEERWYRVKPQSTADVRVTGWFEQMDKHGDLKGQLGGFTTSYGRVTAFTDETRQELWENPEQYVGALIEVQYKELYDTGKFRYAVKFLRFRTDKDEESFDAT